MKNQGCFACCNAPLSLSIESKRRVHKKAGFLIVFGTGIFMRRWALSEGRGSTRRI